MWTPIRPPRAEWPKDRERRPSGYPSGLEPTRSGARIGAFFPSLGAVPKRPGRPYRGSIWRESVETQIPFTMGPPRSGRGDGGMLPNDFPPWQTRPIGWVSDDFVPSVHVFRRIHDVPRPDARPESAVRTRSKAQPAGRWFDSPIGQSLRKAENKGIRCRPRRSWGSASAHISRVDNRDRAPTV